MVKLAQPDQPGHQESLVPRDHLALQQPVQLAQPDHQEPQQPAQPGQLVLQERLGTMVKLVRLGPRVHPRPVQPDLQEPREPMVKLVPPDHPELVGREL